MPVPAAQRLLFPDPQPLVERLGRDFFRGLPECAGVYLMRDAHDAILYVGKAKNLRKRLGSYRVANPDRMRRHHLRLLSAVSHIEIQECLDESTALAREAELLRAIRPNFNRAGTWPAPPRYFAWRCVDQELHLAVRETAETDWQSHGPLGGRATVLRAVLARLVWLAVHSPLGVAALPLGWFHGALASNTTIACGSMAQSVALNLRKLFAGQTEDFVGWIRSKLPSNLHPFESASIEADLEALGDAIHFQQRIPQMTEDGVNWQVDEPKPAESPPIPPTARRVL